MLTLSNQIKVLIMGGYPMSWADAKAWALRHWPDINIYNEGILPLIVETHQIKLGGRMTCIPFHPDKSKNELIFFIVIRTKQDPLSTPYKHRQFREGNLALKCKELIFGHEGDKELTKKSQFTTIAGPWKEWPHVSLYFHSETSLTYRLVPSKAVCSCIDPFFF